MIILRRYPFMMGILSFKKEGIKMKSKEIFRLVKEALKNFCLFVALLGFVECVYSEQPHVSGFINTTYNYDFNKPLSRTTALRSYDNQTNTILLNAVHTSLTGSIEEGIGYTIEADYGSDAALNTPGGAGDGDDFDLQEAYLTYHVGLEKGIDLTVGKFVTLEGIEVIESPDNFNISRGFLYGLTEPFTHTGAKIDYEVNSWSQVTLGIVNGWDLASDNNNGKTGIWRLGFDFGDPLSFGISGTYGPEKADNDKDNRTSIDVTGSSKLCSSLVCAFQFNYGEEEGFLVGSSTRPVQWRGFAIQPKWDITESFSLGTRYEYLEDDDGSRTGTKQVLRNVAVTPTLKLNESITVRAEYRHDWSNKKVFENDKGVFNKKNTSTSMVEFIYAF